MLGSRNQHSIEPWDLYWESVMYCFKGEAIARARRVRAIAKSNSQDTKWNWIQSEMDESPAIAISRKLLPETAVTHFRYAELLHARDDFVQARIHVVAASELFAEMNMAWWSARAAKLRSTLLN